MPECDFNKMEHQHKFFAILCRFWLLREWLTALAKSVKKGKFVKKILLQIMLNEVQVETSSFET